MIEECARLDNLEIDEKVSQTLAEDLAENDRVRPPELQIVCTALTGSLELSDYYKRGGASGILSHYIDEAISLCPDKSLGSQALRLLCDFSLRTKKPPKTSEELLDEIGVRTSRERSRILLESILRQFERGRLVLSFNRRGQPTTYALVHDYLVGIVDSATKGVTTPAEQANQLLNYYIAEPGIRARSTVGLRELWLLKKHADKTRLDSPQARRLLKRSRNAVIARTLGIVVLVSISAAVVYALFTTKRGWKQTVLGQHFESGQFISAPPIGVSPKHSLIITGIPQDGGSEHAKLWNMKTGGLVRAIDGKNLWHSHSDNFIWSLDENPIVMHDLLTGKPYQVPVKNKDVMVARNASDNAVAYLETATDAENRSNWVVKIWSTFNQKEIGKVAACEVGNTRRNFLSANGDRLLRLCWSNGRGVPLLWDTKQEQAIASLSIGDGSSEYFDVNERASLIATEVWTEQPRCRVQLWDLASGRPLRIADLDTEYCRSEFSWTFSPQGSFLLINRNNELESLLSVSDLSPPHWFSATYKDAVATKSISGYALWQTESGTYIWKLDSSDPVFYKDMKIARTGERPVTFGFFISEKNNRAIIDKINGFEIWDLQTGERLHDILFTEDSTDFVLSQDGGAIVYSLAGGRLVMYSIVTGERIGELADTGGSQRVVYYDARCKSAYVWTGEGRVLRYSQGTEVLGRWFFPTTTCP